MYAMSNQSKCMCFLIDHEALCAPQVVHQQRLLQLLEELLPPLPPLALHQQLQLQLHQVHPIRTIPHMTMQTS